MKDGEEMIVVKMNKNVLMIAAIAAFAFLINVYVSQDSVI